MVERVGVMQKLLNSPTLIQVSSQDVYSYYVKNDPFLLKRQKPSEDLDVIIFLLFLSFFFIDTCFNSWSSVEQRLPLVID